MTVNDITSEQQYDDALRRIAQLIRVELIEGSEQQKEVELLSILIKQYEQIHYPI